MRRILSDIVLEVITDVLLIGLAGNLLYLYFIRAWQEPCLFILLAELAVLIATIGLGIGRVTRFTQKIRKGRLENEMET